MPISKAVKQRVERKDNPTRVCGNSRTVGVGVLVAVGVNVGVAVAVGVGVLVLVGLGVSDGVNVIGTGVEPDDR